MTGKYDALIARLEARRPRYNQTSIDGDIGKDIDAAIAALREAQAHVPPEGWRATEYTHEGRGMCVQWFISEGYWAFWPTENREWSNGHPTAAAAMAAIETHDNG